MEIGDALEAMRAEICAELRALRMETNADAVTFARAAERLDCSVSTVKRLVRTGRLLTVRVGDDPRVPVSELRRLTTPVETPRQARRPKPPPSAREDAEATLKRLR